jgi:hypothetical protein
MKLQRNLKNLAMRESEFYSYSVFTGFISFLTFPFDDISFSSEFAKLDSRFQSHNNQLVKKILNA